MQNGIQSLAGGLANGHPKGSPLFVSSCILHFSLLPTSPSRRHPVPDSVRRQIPLDLPRRHVPDVVEPLLPLRFDEVLEYVLAEGLADEVVLLELVERLAQVARQLVDAQMPPLAMAHLVDVLV